MLFYYTETMMITFLLCHMLGVSSSCTNPILYGFINDNFLKAASNAKITSYTLCSMRSKYVFSNY